jgi:hypothetical protein
VKGDGHELFYSTAGKLAKIMAVDIAVKHGAIRPRSTAGRRY